MATLRERLRPFYVLENPHWTELAELQLLDARTRAELIAEVNDLLFLWALMLDRPGDPAALRSALGLCDRALVFTRERGPWLGLRSLLAGRLGVGTAEPGPSGQAESVSPGEAFQWGLLLERQDRLPEALGWMRRSVRRAPADPWRHAYLAHALARAGERTEAQNHADVAVALRPRSPGARIIRARVERAGGDNIAGLEDYRRRSTNSAPARTPGTPRPKTSCAGSLIRS